MSEQSERIMSLMLRALEKGLMIHGGGPGEIELPRYPEPVRSVMISATTKTKIIVYAAATERKAEDALEKALTNALERADSKVAPLKGGRS